MSTDLEQPSKTSKRPDHWGAYLEMLISSALGLWAALQLSIDAVILAANSNAELSCNINAKISCGAVALSDQAKLLGFPNSFLGLITEPVVITIAIAGLSRVKFPRWFMLTAQFFYTLGLIFAYWLFYESYFTIHRLCPWCLLVTATTTLVFASMTRINILEGNFGQSVKQRMQRPLAMWMDVWIVLIVLAIMAAMIIVRYL